ncbi:MAG: hypothetical protein QOI35_117 [Cryptosporangiaceae bacterium]|nr:hypothetical protein [Cryptosporangiaceae bacterium]
MSIPVLRTMKSRASVALGGSATLVLALALGAAAAVITPSAPRVGSLVQVGPLADGGFPAWYRDSNNVRLEACLTQDDPLCPTPPGSVPNPNAPVSFPGNFPDELFYQLAGATVTMSNGVQATIGMDLEGAFATGAVIDGDQMVFGRIRIRFNAPAGEKFRIIHPYGVDEIVADAVKGVNMTQDVGLTPGAFGGALKSRIGPFLRWDPSVAPAAPAGYVGNPGVDHKVVGSPYNTNFVRIERIDDAGNVLADLGGTDVFSLQGRLATNAGVDVDQATYTSNADGTGFVEVYATSEPGQAIQVAGNAALGFRSTRLRGSNGHYYGRFPVTRSVPDGTSIEVVNASDTPVARKTKPLTDVVTVSGVRYDADANTLAVTASSSDKDSSPGVLSVTGFGPIGSAPFPNVAAPPATVTVTSSSGGSTTVPVSGTGALFLPDAPIAAALAPSEAALGQRVVLDGTGSAGEIDTWAWTQTSGPPATLTGANTAQASFAPSALGSYTFELTVTGPGGTSAPASVTITATSVQPPTASAGPDQTVVRGRAVTLDASATKAVDTVTWSQVSGPAVTLSNPAAVKPTFTYPLMPLPAAPGPNASYVPNNAPVVLRVTATGPGGTATDDVVISPQPETISGITARYRTRQEYRITGTTNLIAGQRIVVVLGSAGTGQVIGSATVDAVGAFAVRATTPLPGSSTTISVLSATGGRVLGFPLTITN